MVLHKYGYYQTEYERNERKNLKNVFYINLPTYFLKSLKNNDYNSRHQNLMKVLPVVIYILFALNAL